jgi:hypothetical protein
MFASHPSSSNHAALTQYFCRHDSHAACPGKAGDIVLHM